MIQDLLSKAPSARTRFFRGCRTVGFIDALRWHILFRNRNLPLQVRSKLLNRRIWIRPGTSDWIVFLKVLDDEEYAFPVNLGEPKFIVDAGANIGLTTLYFAWKYPQSKIYAVEPERSNLELLRRNCEGLSSVKIIPAALWSRPSNLYIADPNSEKWTFSVTENSSPGGVVKSVTINELLAESGRDSIDILKLDIEGAEKHLFSEGWLDWLPRVRAIMIELHDRFIPGCSHSFYSAIATRPFCQEINGENILIQFDRKSV